MEVSVQNFRVITFHLKFRLDFSFLEVMMASPIREIINDLMFSLQALPDPRDQRICLMTLF